MGGIIKGKKIAMIIAFREFKDEEYFIPKEILESSGAEITTISDSDGKAIGVSGGEAEIDILSKDAVLKDYDAVLFAGGGGAQKYFDNADFHKIAKETTEQGKILGAICIAPVILAKAGVLKGKKATVWNSALDKSAVKILKDNGVIFKNKNIIIDGKIITASGPEFSEEFAKSIIESLK